MLLTKIAKLPDY